LALDPDVGVEVATDAVARAVKAGADTAKVLHSYHERFEVNFGTDDVTLVRSTVGDDLSITVFVDGRRGSVDLTGRAHDAVDHAVRDALTAAQAGEPDPANVLPSEPADPAISGGGETPDKEAMFDAVVRFVADVRRRYPLIQSRDASHYAFDCQWISYANSFGRVQHARRGASSLMFMAAGKDGERATSFNYTRVIGAEPFDDLSAVVPVQRILDGVSASFDPEPVPSTFVGDLIFTPESMLTLIGTLANALSGMALMRKATPYTDHLGTSIAAPAFTLLHRPGELAGAAAFDDEGFINRDVDIVRAGVLQNYIIGWYASRKLGRPMTTGCLDFVVAPGEQSVDDIIGATKRGILLGRFSGGMPSQNLDFSGVAKNSFYVEDGRVVGPIAETMIAGNFQRVLEQIRAVSRETINFGFVEFPWMATGGATISTK
jgi:PmbA protein